MKFSTRCRYGARAMVELARNFKTGPMKRREIEKLHGISRGYLENILCALKEHNLVLTMRGAEGGFVLKKRPEEITIFDIVIALEGSIAPVDCIENPDLCDRIPNCATRPVWIKLYEAQCRILQSVTLRDLLEKGPSDLSIDV